MYRVNKWKSIKRKSKYNNTTCMYGGNRYDSKFEAKYAEDLDWRVKAGEVKRWERQVRISLDVNGHHIANYYIDFVVYLPDGTKQYMEIKGFETEVWRLKWRLFEALINEIDPGSELIVVK